MVAQLDKFYRSELGLKRTLKRLAAWLLFEGRPLTTKGRWINPLIQAGYRIYPSLGKVEKPIFIIGTGRSGTTLLGKLLSGHEDVLFLNEPKALWLYANAEDDVIGSYSKRPGKFCLTQADATNTIKRNLTRIYSFFLKLTDSERIVDKYPELLFRQSYVRKIFPDAQFLYLLRDGIDAVYSIKDWSERKGVKNANWWGYKDRKWTLMVEQLVPLHPELQKHQDWLASCDNHITRGAVEWILSTHHGLASEGVMTIRYEDLVKSPAETLKSICDYTDMEEDSDMIRYAKKVVGKVSAEKTITLDNRIVPIFEQTMKKAGYSCENRLN